MTSNNTDFRKKKILLAESNDNLVVYGKLVQFFDENRVLNLIVKGILSTF